MTPYEIIGAPLTLWLAPVGTAFPLIDAAPAGTWVKVGTNGDRNYDEAGVTVTHGETFAEVATAGSTGPVKAFLTAESLKIALTMLDVSLEQYAIALNDAAITSTAAGAGTAGFKKVGLSQGENVVTYALLARGVSPYGDGMSAQYEVPRCYQSAQAAPVFRKGVPAGLQLEFTALEDATAANAAERFGRLVAQTAAAL